MGLLVPLLRSHALRFLDADVMAEDQRVVPASRPDPLKPRLAGALLHAVCRHQLPLVESLGRKGTDGLVLFVEETEKTSQSLKFMVWPPKNCMYWSLYTIILASREGRAAFRNADKNSMERTIKHAKFEML